jgi:hypothetical protein
MFSHLSENFLVWVTRKHLQQFILSLLVFPLAFENDNDAVNDLSLQTASGIIDFNIEHLKSTFGWAIEFRRSAVGMNNQIDQNLFDLMIPTESKTFDEVLHPNLSVVFQILSDHLVKIFSHNETFVSNATDYTRHQHHIVLSFSTILRVENHLDDLL